MPRINVEREIGEWKKRNKEDDWHGFLNNFWCNLPDPAYSEGCRYAMLVQELGWMDKLNKDVIDPKSDSHQSQLYLNRTPRQFFQDVELAIQESGISKSELERLQRLNHEDFMGRHIYKLYDLVLPIYKILREKGYNHHDLAG